MPFQQGLHLQVPAAVKAEYRQDMDESRRLSTTPEIWEATPFHVWQQWKQAAKELQLMEKAKMEMVSFWQDMYPQTPVQESELWVYQQFLEMEHAKKLVLAPEKRTPPPVFELWRWQM